MANRRLGNLGKLGIFFPSFLLPSFRFWVLVQNRKVGREKVGNKISRFSSFRPGQFQGMICKTEECKNIESKTIELKIWS